MTWPPAVLALGYFDRERPQESRCGRLALLIVLVVTHNWGRIAMKGASLSLSQLQLSAHNLVKI